MKLRSESRSAAPPAMPIPFTIPATQAITIRNASSPLIRLPQELKDHIYHFVCGDLYVHTYEHIKWPYICLFTCNNTSPHRNTVHDLYRLGKRLPVAFLGLCRQMYHDTKMVMYTANIFDFRNPKVIRSFIRRLDDASHRNLAVRSVVLDIGVTDRNREREWDSAFREVAENFKNLRHLRIEIGEYIWDRPRTRRHSPAYRKTPFLRGLLELKQLPLKTVELVMEERIHGGPIRESQYIWTLAQKQEWAKRMKSAILGSE